MEEEIRNIRRGQAVIGQGLLLPHTVGYSPNFKSEMGDYDPARARALLDDWDTTLKRFVKVMPKDYRRALQQIEAERLASANVAAE